MVTSSPVYVILEQTDKDLIQEEINSKLQNGWWLHGPLHVSSRVDRHIEEDTRYVIHVQVLTYTQAMTKPGVAK